MGDVVELKADLLRIEEAAKVLRVGKTKLYELIGRGEIPVVRMGSWTVRISRRALDAWVEQQARCEGRRVA